MTYTEPAAEAGTDLRSCAQGSMLQRIRPHLPNAGCAELLEFQRHIALDAPATAVFAQICNLHGFCRWWPGAQALRPLPPGLCSVGDCGTLQIHGTPALLRILRFRPAGLLALLLDQPDGVLVLELEVSPTTTACRVRLRLQSPAPLALAAQTRAARQLHLQGMQAAAALTQWLESDRP